MRLPIRYSLLFVSLLLGAACASTDGAVGPNKRQQQLDDIVGMDGAWVYGDIVIGGNPEIDALRCGKRRGYATVIDLCGATPLRYDPAELEALGMRYVSVPLDGYEVTDQQVDRVMSELEGREAGVLMHCSNGGRAAMMLAIFRAAYEDVDLDVAIEDARQAGMKPGALPEAAVRAQVRRLRDARPS